MKSKSGVSFFLSSAILVMATKEGDDDSTSVADKEMKTEKNQSAVMLVVLVNAFLFSSCFFMVESVFPVSTHLNNFLERQFDISKRRLN